jgi:hypothetical protein
MATAHRGYHAVDVCAEPIFVIGSPRSGTSILPWSLAQHSMLWTSVESDIWAETIGDKKLVQAYNSAAARPDGSEWLCTHHVSLEEYQSFIAMGLNALFSSRSCGKRWIDQTPRNTLIADVLAKALPGARFLHMLRDGRRVVHSMVHFKNLLTDGLVDRFVEAKRLPSWATDFRQACITWRHYVRTCLAFEEENRDRCLTVVNERISADTQSEFERIFEFLDIPVEDGPVEYFRTKRINSSFKGHSQPHPGTMSQPWLEWDDEQRNTFVEEAGDTMVACRLATSAEMDELSSSSACVPLFGNIATDVDSADSQARGSREHAAEPTRQSKVQTSPTSAPGDRASSLASRSESATETIESLAMLAAELVRSDHFRELFHRCEQRGVHITPVHFYSPIPDTRSLGDELFQLPSALHGIKMNEEQQLELLRGAFRKFQEECGQIPLSSDNLPRHVFHLNNGRFDGTDALVCHCLLRELKPRKIVEVGSGYSSRLAAQAALLNGVTELTCIEPFPDDVLKTGFPGLTNLVQRRVQDVPIQHFRALQSGDVLFIDSSHVAAIGSDVNYLFLEVLPAINPGVVVHVHDIFLPMQYRKDWVKEELRFWNEQYLLQAFLMFNSDFEVLFANSYMARLHMDEFRKTFPKSPWWGGGSFWMKRALA